VGNVRELSDIPAENSVSLKIISFIKLTLLIWKFLFYKENP
jgi:hypothetical protein